MGELACIEVQVTHQAITDSDMTSNTVVSVTLADD